MQLQENVDDPKSCKDSVDQQLSQKQSLDPRSHTGAQVFELSVPPELWWWDKEAEKGKGSVVGMQRGSASVELIVAF